MQKYHFYCFSLLAKLMSQTFVLVSDSSTGSWDKKGVEGTVQKMGLVLGTKKSSGEIFHLQGLVEGGI